MNLENQKGNSETAENEKQTRSKILSDVEVRANASLTNLWHEIDRLHTDKDTPFLGDVKYAISETRGIIFELVKAAVHGYFSEGYIDEKIRHINESVDNLQDLRCRLLSRR